MKADKAVDVVILGGAFSGAAAAILLRRERPDLRVLVVERAAAFDAKVGEATTEMSAMFLTRRLAMWEHLEREHLPKEGLRYWFSNREVTGHAQASEVGGTLRSAVCSFLLRRDTLDEHLLATAVAEGAELWRPARASSVTLGDFDHRVTVERDGGEEVVACRWLLDATGRATFLGRRLEIVERNHDHPTAAVWCRWQGVRHVDDLAARGPLAFSRGNVSSRRLATNHYMGYGYWVWFIALGNGETSVGIVYDKRIHELSHGKDRAAEYRAFLDAIPAAAELLAGARMRGEDLRSYSHLAYSARQYMGTGWALVGDAAAFLDPYYSPGLDHASFSVEATVAVASAEIAGELRGAPLAARIAEHNETFVRSYRRFFEAVYRDKYLYMGEHDLLGASFLLDTAHYYIFVVIPAYRFFGRFHWMPVLGPKPAFLSYHLMRFYSRRFRSIALARRAAGEDGRRNHGRRVRAYYDLDLAPFRMGVRGLALWGRAELDYCRLRLRRLLRPGRQAHPGTPAPPPLPAAETSSEQGGGAGIPRRQAG
jgi:flavin-dependent dehydrogenase